MWIHKLTKIMSRPKQEITNIILTKHWDQKIKSGSHPILI